MLSKLRSFVVVGTTAIGVLVLGSACGGDDTTTGQPAAAPCDSSKCLAGNTCLPLNGVTSCRKTCSTNDQPATDCPFGYNCTDTQPGSSIPPFCVASTAVGANGSPLTQAATGQWGTPCQPNLGSTNPACDTADNFLCYGVSPTDANAYCTQYGCTKDSDCGPGFGCTKINASPNVKTATELTIGQEQAVCLKRTYCSACTSDVDCPSVSGTAQHCITDKVGRAFCTPECSTTANCNTEATCATVILPSSVQQKVCYPRSSVCVGDGTLCSSCLIDTDCGADGVCLKSEYSTEKACAKKAPNGDCNQCPKTVTTTTPVRGVGCADTANGQVPVGYCVGTYSIGGQAGADIGCWTPNR